MVVTLVTADVGIAYGDVRFAPIRVGGSSVTFRPFRYDGNASSRSDDRRVRALSPMIRYDEWSPDETPCRCTCRFVGRRRSDVGTVAVVTARWFNVPGRPTRFAVEGVPCRH